MQVRESLTSVLVHSYAKNLLKYIKKEKKIQSMINLTMCLLKNEIFVVQKRKLHILKNDITKLEKEQKTEHAFHSRKPKVTQYRGQEYCKQHDVCAADNLDLTSNPALSLLLGLW